MVVALIEERKRIDLEMMKTQSAFIAHCVWGGNPDKLTEDKTEVLGIDKPVNPQALKGWY